VLDILGMLVFLNKAINHSKNRC